MVVFHLSSIFFSSRRRTICLETIKFFYSLLSQLEIHTTPVLIKDSEVKLLDRIPGKVCSPPPFSRPKWSVMLALEQPSGTSTGRWKWYPTKGRLIKLSGGCHSNDSATPARADWLATGSVTRMVGSYRQSHKDGGQPELWCTYSEFNPSMKRHERQFQFLEYSMYVYMSMHTYMNIRS